MVRTEQRTGGRLGGILPLNAVRAALDGGLETDLSRIAAATITPVIEGGTLDFDEVPTFGSVALSAGFSPDPYRLNMVSGGEVQADYLGAECVGYAAVAPDFRVNWSGNSSELQVRPRVAPRRAKRLRDAPDGGQHALRPAGRPQDVRPAGRHTCRLPRPGPANE